MEQLPLLVKKRDSAMKSANKQRALQLAEEQEERDKRIGLEKTVEALTKQR